MDPFHQGKWGRCLEKMMDFTNFKIEMVTLARFNDEK
jgi:hypothetical protein